jgi:hypothetical protein
MTRARSDMRRSARQLMENALTLDVNELLRGGTLARGSRTRGVISWIGPAGETAGWVSYEADMTRAGDGRMRLHFSTPDPRGGDRRQVDQHISLTATRPGFGGERWWFVDDGRRVGQLHLPPGADQFRSRRAYSRGEPFDISMRPLGPAPSTVGMNATTTHQATLG